MQVVDGLDPHTSVSIPRHFVLAFFAIISPFSPHDVLPLRIRYHIDWDKQPLPNTVTNHAVPSTPLSTSTAWFSI